MRDAGDHDGGSDMRIGLVASGDLRGKAPTRSGWPAQKAMEDRLAERARRLGVIPSSGNIRSSRLARLSCRRNAKGWMSSAGSMPACR